MNCHGSDDPAAPSRLPPPNEGLAAPAPDTATLRRLLPEVVALARAAGALILDVYAGDFCVGRKADASPVTLADERAEALIVPALQALSPGWPVVAEEAASRGLAPTAAPTFWLVDPLDGTREFVQRNGEFTVNIALVHGGAPVLGVVLQPVGGWLLAGVVGQGAADPGQAWEAWGGQPGQRRALRVRPVPAQGWTLATSRSHGDEAALQAWLAQGLAARGGARPVAERLNAGSSLKFGLLAAGRADVYPRLGRTMEWDTAAGHAVLAAAGGSVCTLDGAPLRYGKPGYENPHFVAWGGSGAGPAPPG